MALIKMIVGKDYTQQLKNQRLVSVGLLLVGIVGIVCYFTLVPGSTLEDFTKGFYIGGASGITAGALILLIRCTYLPLCPPFSLPPHYTKKPLYWFGTTAKNSKGPSLLLIREWERPLGQ